MMATQNMFDPASYLAANPDVARAIEQGWFASPEEHFNTIGFREVQNGRPMGVTAAPQLPQLPVPGSQPPATQPTYVGPTIGDISGVMTPRFNTLDQGQQGILANQGVLQQDIGTVGTGVANVGNAIGTPANGQTIFGDLGNLGTQVGGLMTNFDQFGNDLSSFRGAFDTNVNRTANTLNDIQEQGLSGRQEINRALQDQQPAIYRTDAAVGSMAANPMFAGGAGFMAPMSAPQTTNQTANTNAGLNAAAQNQNVAMGPMGPMAVDPRDMV